MTEEKIQSCLTRTDFTGHNADHRAAIGWHIDYARRVKEVTCCALQPRTDILSKRSDLAAFKAELLGRIDLIETQGSAASPEVAPSEVRQLLRKHDLCYGALMDLYHDVTYAQRPPRR